MYDYNINMTCDIKTKIYGDMKKIDLIFSLCKRNPKKINLEIYYMF